jgi:ATP-dependent 26S proteasome regulatory subunit
VSSIVGILADDADPMVSVMKVEKAPMESYADIGGLESQVNYIHCVIVVGHREERLELSLFHQ